MKKTLIIISLFSTGFLFSCDDQKKKSNESAVEESATEMSVPSDTTTRPISGDQNNTITPSASPTVEAQSTATGMNPAHGEPGHRCDIAVGAPLNSPPGKQNVITPTTSQPTMIDVPQTITPAATPAPTTPTAAGMNPPHGQPGHDCSIAVGAPLKK